MVDQLSNASDLLDICLVWRLMASSNKQGQILRRSLQPHQWFLCQCHLSGHPWGLHLGDSPYFIGYPIILHYPYVSPCRSLFWSCLDHGGRMDIGQSVSGTHLLHAATDEDRFNQPPRARNRKLCTIPALLLCCVQAGFSLARVFLRCLSVFGTCSVPDWDQWRNEWRLSMDVSALNI